MNLDLKKEIQVLINKFKAAEYIDVVNKCLVLLKNNNNDFLWNLLGLCYQNLFQYKKSIDCFENTIKINPKNIAALNNLGISYKNLRDYKKAEYYLTKVLEKNPNYLNAIVNLANIKNDTFYFKEAIDYYDQALKIDTNNSLIYLNIANAYQSINQVEKAKDYLNKALKIDSLFTLADHKLSLLENYNSESLHLKSMIEKIQKEKLADNKKVNLYFGIAKGYEDCKNYDKSIDYLKLGNNLQRSLLNYNRKFYTNLTKKIKSLFSTLNLENLKNSSKGEDKIFILGMPRSGTTLIEKIISTHSKVSTVSETNFISDKMSKYFYQDEKVRLSGIHNFLNSNINLEYDNFINFYNSKNEKIIDKTLSNFWYIGFIKIFFPKSKIIHSYRNPNDNILSIYKNLFDTHEAWLYNEDELKEYFKSYQEIMLYWNNIYGDQILSFKYEDLIEKPKEKIQDLIKFCDLEWEENCLNFYNNKNPIKTLSVNQANKPLYKTSIKKSELYQAKLPNLFFKSS